MKSVHFAIKLNEFLQLSSAADIANWHFSITPRKILEIKYLLKSFCRLLKPMMFCQMVCDCLSKKFAWQ